jgi:hypothetical protein
MNLELTDEKTEFLARELRDLIDADRYFLSPRVRMLRDILNKIKPEPVPMPRKRASNSDASRSLPRTSSARRSSGATWTAKRCAP